MNKKNIVRVRGVMKQNFDIVDGMLTVSDALNAMKNVETKCLVVNKRSENDEYGLVLISDIAKQVLAKDRSPERVNIYEIMSKPVLTVEPSMDIRYCARFFDRFEISTSPVISKGQIVGVVSYNDLVLKGMEKAISKGEVTYDFHRLMDDAKLLKCSEFGQAVEQASGLAIGE